MTLHPAAHPRPVAEGCSFLGFVVFPDHRRVKRRKGLYFRRKLKHLLASNERGRLPLAQVTASVRGWVNHLRYANTVGLRKAALAQRIRPPTPE